MIELNGLDASLVKECCEDNLVQKEYIPATAISALFKPFIFSEQKQKEMLEDMIRYMKGQLMFSSVSTFNSTLNKRAKNNSVPALSSLVRRRTLYERFGNVILLKIMTIFP